MGDHAAEPKLSPLEYLATRAKAAVFVVAATVLSVVTAFVADPDTSDAIAGFLPEQFRFIVPIVLGIVGTIVLERTRNADEDAIREKKQAGLAA